MFRLSAVVTEKWGFEKDGQEKHCTASPIIKSRTWPTKVSETRNSISRAFHCIVSTSPRCVCKMILMLTRQHYAIPRLVESKNLESCQERWSKDFREFMCLGNQPVVFGTWLLAQVGTWSWLGWKLGIIKHLEMPQNIGINIAMMTRKSSKFNDLLFGKYIQN